MIEYQFTHHFYTSVYTCFLFIKIVFGENYTGWSDITLINGKSVPLPLLSKVLNFMCALKVLLSYLNFHITPRTKEIECLHNVHNNSIL